MAVEVGGPIKKKTNSAQMMTNPLLEKCAIVKPKKGFSQKLAKRFALML